MSGELPCHAYGWRPDRHHIAERFREGFFQVYCSCGWVTNAWYTERIDAWVEALDHHPQAPNMYEAYINHTYRPTVTF